MEGKWAVYGGLRGFRGFERAFGGLQGGTLSFLRLKEALNRRFERCFRAILGFLETIEFGGG